MPINPLLRRIAMNKHKHIVLKGGRITYHSGVRNTLRGAGTVARQHMGEGILAIPFSRQMSHLSIGEGIPAPKHFTRKQKSHSKPIHFKF